MYMKKLNTIILLFGIAFSVMAEKPPVVKKTVKPVELTKVTFQEKVFDYEQGLDEWKYNGDKPAIVDFYAAWCGPCRITSPILAELAVEYGDEIYIYKIDVDKEPELAAVFGIRNLPTFIFIPMDENPQVAMGALPKTSFKEAIDKVLLKKDETKEL